MFNKIALDCQFINTTHQGLHAGWVGGGCAPSRNTPQLPESQKRAPPSPPSPL